MRPSEVPSTIRCPACGAVIKPKPGDCCVFCSYGSARCTHSQSG